MNGGFLPVSRKEMKERGWDQVDFVYISGDAYVDHPPLVMPSSQGCWNPVATEWESLHSRTGRHLTASRFLANHVLDFLYLQEIWIPWSTIIPYPKATEDRCLHTRRCYGKAAGLCLCCLRESDPADL